MPVEEMSEIFLIKRRNTRVEVAKNLINGAAMYHKYRKKNLTKQPSVLIRAKYFKRIKTINTVFGFLVLSSSQIKFNELCPNNKKLLKKTLM